MDNRAPAENKQYFLATTALEEFWDASKPLLFLGEWCRRHSRQAFWEPLGGRVIENPWRDRQKLLDAYHYVNTLYEKLIPAMSRRMNLLHGTEHGDRYWRIVLGPWLQWYISILYDRYTCCMAALESYPNLTTLGLPEESFVTPSDTMDFILKIYEDTYNLQLYTRIFAVIGKDYPKKKLLSVPPGEKWKTMSWKRWLRSGVYYAGLLGQNRSAILLKSSYFPPLMEWELVLKTHGIVWPDLRSRESFPGVPKDVEKRNRLKEVDIGPSNPFEELLKKSLNEDIPSSFVENFATIRKKVLADYPKPPKVIFSANAWYFDEVFKLWAADSAEKGTKLAGVQHGGNYGSAQYLPSEDHEIAITDRYYTWGWNDNAHDSKIVPMPAPKLIGRKALGADNNRKGVLFVATSLPRYFILQFPLSTSQHVKYLAWQKRFVQTLSFSMRENLRVRLHYADFGWDMRERWKENSPEVMLENWNIPFKKSLEESRLFVCDHLSTTFIEALSVNKPAILFWDPETIEVRESAKSYYEALRVAGILHDSPEKASHAVDLVYSDVENWWNEPVRQAAVKEFCHRFARTSPDAVDEWAWELRRMAGKI